MTKAGAVEGGRGGVAREVVAVDCDAIFEGGDADTTAATGGEDTAGGVATAEDCGAIVGGGGIGTAAAVSI